MAGDEGEGEKGVDVQMVGDCQLYFHGEDGPVGVGVGRGDHGWGIWLSGRERAVKTFICTYKHLWGRSDGVTD